MIGAACLDRVLRPAIVLIMLLLAAPNPADAAEEHPLRPPDTSSPRATLYGFIAATDDIYRRMRAVIDDYRVSERLFPTAEQRQRQIAALRDAQAIVRFLDLSDIPSVLRDSVPGERLLQLKEILDRIDIPVPADVPGRNEIAQQNLKRWRLPNTEIDIALVEQGPRAGEYLFSAGTIDRLPQFYERVRHLPYRHGPGAQLQDAYRTISSGGSSTIYEAFLSSPVGLSYLVPARWMLSLPGWAKARIAGVAAWQWLGLGVAFLIGGLIIIGSVRLARRRNDEGEAAPASRWRTLMVPLAIVAVAGLLLPLFNAVLRIGGGTRIAIEYALTGALFVSAAWLALVMSAVLGEAIVASERLTVRSLDSQLVRLGARLVGLVVAIALVIHGADELGFPAYSVLAGLGVGGLAVALAARDTIANLIGSLMIALEKPFRVGHLVRISGRDGTVEDVGFRSTRIRTLDNSLVSIPSSAVVNSAVENLTLRDKRRQRFFVQIRYDTPREKIEALTDAIRQLVADHPLAEDSTCHVRFNNFGESSLDILVIFHLQVSDYGIELKEREAMMLRILDLARDLGVELAFPTRTLNVEGLVREAAERPVPEDPAIGFIRRA